MSTILATGSRARGVGGGAARRELRRGGDECAADSQNHHGHGETHHVSDHLLGCLHGRGWSFDTERHYGQGVWWLHDRRGAGVLTGG